MTSVLDGAAQRTAARALFVAIPLVVVLWVNADNATNELLTSTDIAVILAAGCIGLALTASETSRSWGLALALGAIAAVPLFVACLFCLFMVSGPIGG
jgi:heme A synthase